MTTPNPEIDVLSFEAAYTQLEDIVQKLESGGLSLDQSLDLYEKGQKLSAHCAKLLDNAELRVRQLVGDEYIPLDE
ncbi:MAG: exodeoxyribonuclease VII small subunit [Chloroflexi bacterium]|nr:exodeoxyribonuclease VII small subunit [Chloroflexota bacterium]